MSYKDPYQPTSIMECNKGCDHCSSEYSRIHETLRDSKLRDNSVEENRCCGMHTKSVSHMFGYLGVSKIRGTPKSYPF